MRAQQQPQKSNAQVARENLRDVEAQALRVQDYANMQMLVVLTRTVGLLLSMVEEQDRQITALHSRIDGLADYHN